MSWIVTNLGTIVSAASVCFAVVKAAGRLVIAAMSVKSSIDSLKASFDDLKDELAAEREARATGDAELHRRIDSAYSREHRQ